MSILISTISIIISRISILISILSMIIHGSAPLKQQEILGIPTMYLKKPTVHYTSRPKTQGGQGRNAQNARRAKKCLDLSSATTVDGINIA